jgi:hypothetical protein
MSSDNDPKIERFLSGTVSLKLTSDGQRRQADIRYLDRTDGETRHSIRVTTHHPDLASKRALAKKLRQTIPYSLDELPAPPRHDISLVASWATSPNHPIGRLARGYAQDEFESRKVVDAPELTAALHHATRWVTSENRPQPKNHAEDSGDPSSHPWFLFPRTESPTHNREIAQEYLLQTTPPREAIDRPSETGPSSTAPLEEERTPKENQTLKDLLQTQRSKLRGELLQRLYPEEQDMEGADETIDDYLSPELLTNSLE